MIRDLESQTDKEHKCALIFDDSLYACTGGKGTDLCGKVYVQGFLRKQSSAAIVGGLRGDCVDRPAVY